MIIQIRGTSGSGKTTVMKEIMGDMQRWYPILRMGRQKPLYYMSSPKSMRPTIAILGHYEAACGGCDTIGSAPKVYELIQEVKKTRNPDFIICEGLLLSEDNKWTKQMVEDGDELRILYLRTTLEECLARVTKRREDAGNTKPLNPAKTINRVKAIESSLVKLSAFDVKIIRVSSDRAAKVVWQWMTN